MHWDLFDALVDRLVQLRAEVGWFPTILEWPRQCEYWRSKKVKSFLNSMKMTAADFDGCRFGLKSIKRGESSKFLLKPWRLSTNLPDVRELFEERKCHGQGDDHVHARTNGKNAIHSQGYTPLMTMAIHAMVAQFFSKYSQGQHVCFHTNPCYACLRQYELVTFGKTSTEKCCLPLRVQRTCIYLPSQSLAQTSHLPTSLLPLAYVGEVPKAPSLLINPPPKGEAVMASSLGAGNVGSTGSGDPAASNTERSSAPGMQAGGPRSGAPATRDEIAARVSLRPRDDGYPYQVKGKDQHGGPKGKRADSKGARVRSSSRNRGKGSGKHKGPGKDKSLGKQRDLAPPRDLPDQTVLYKGQTMMMSQLLEITGAQRLPYLPEPQEEVKGKGPGKANADWTNYRPGVASTSIAVPGHHYALMSRHERRESRSHSASARVRSGSAGPRGLPGICFEFQDFGECRYGCLCRFRHGYDDVARFTGKGTKGGGKEKGKDPSKGHMGKGPGEKGMEGPLDHPMRPQPMTLESFPPMAASSSSQRQAKRDGTLGSTVRAPSSRRGSGDPATPDAASRAVDHPIPISDDEVSESCGDGTDEEKEQELTTLLGQGHPEKQAAKACLAADLRVLSHLHLL